MKKELKNLETSSSNINKTDPKKAIIGLVSTTALSVYM